MTNSLLKRTFQPIKLGRPVMVIGLNNDLKSGLVYLKPTHASPEDTEKMSQTPQMISIQQINVVSKFRITATRFHIDTFKSRPTWQQISRLTQTISENNRNLQRQLQKTHIKKKKKTLENNRSYKYNISCKPHCLIYNYLPSFFHV